MSKVFVLNEKKYTYMMFNGFSEAKFFQKWDEKLFRKNKNITCRLYVVYTENGVKKLETYKIHAPKFERNKLLPNFTRNSVHGVLKISAAEKIMLNVDTAKFFVKCLYKKINVDRENDVEKAVLPLDQVCRNNVNAAGKVWYEKYDPLHKMARIKEQGEILKVRRTYPKNMKNWSEAEIMELAEMVSRYGEEIEFCEMQREHGGCKTCYLAKTCNYAQGRCPKCTAN
jgi:hypothetical protein